MMNQSIPLRTYVASAILCLTLFASCSTDDDADTVLPEGKYPMTFATAMEGLTQTRATTDNTWTGSEKIAVQVGGEVKEYTAATDGKLSAGDPFYWNYSQETKIVTAWYCGDGSTAAGMINAGQVPASWTVQANQAGNDGYAKSDFLYASAEVSFTERETKLLPFYHQTARVVINIKKAEAATNVNEIVSVSIVNTNTTANYAASTTENVGKWIVPSAQANITPKDITDGATYLKSYAALVIPQNMTDQKFIAVELTNGNTYYYTPKENNGKEEANLQSGKQYTYDITVKHGYLEVNASSSGAWTGGGSEDVNSKEPQPGFSATDLKIGDYYYSDGTTSDGGYRKYGDGTTAHLDVNPIRSKTVIGIVFWVGDATQKDKTLRDAHPDCIHGLVVALNDVADGTAAWQNPYSSVQSWLNDYKSGEYLSVTSGTGSSEPLNNIQGYNNTKAIEEFNLANSGNLVQAVVKVIEYRNNVSVPANSSGWYLPSGKELTLLCGTDVDNIWSNNSGGTANRDLINGKLGSISSVATEISSAYYWSSTETNNYRDYAFSVYFDSGYVDASFKYYSYRVRCVLAF